MKRLLCVLVILLGGFSSSAGEPVAPAPASALRERIDHDHLMQLLVYQRREISTRRISLLTTEGDAAGAVDGTRDGKAGFHTNPEVSPWWQVDLGDRGTIAKVRIYNREDYPPGIPLCSRLIISTSADGRTWTQQHPHDGRVVGGAARNDPLEVTFAAPAPGRFLRIHLPADGDKKLILHLAEVEVFGPAGPARPWSRPTDAGLGRGASPSRQSPDDKESACACCQLRAGGRRRPDRAPY